MKKALIICTSPRSGSNSTLLASQFAAGAEDAGIAVETISLADSEPGFCQACYYCLSHSGQCFQQDIMNSVREKLIEADVLVFATPVYFYGMSGQMKTFIDRTIAFYKRIAAREVYLIATSGDPRPSAVYGAVKGLQGFVDCLGADAKLAGVVFGAGVSEAGDARHIAAYDEAYQMGRSIQP